MKATAVAPRAQMPRPRTDLVDITGRAQPTVLAQLLRPACSSSAPRRASPACLNAAAVLQVSGQAVDLYDGLDQARAAVASGAALRKREEWVAVQAGGVVQREAGQDRLGALLVEAGLGE